MDNEYGHIQRLISQGEHQTLDFKFRIDDAAKIARTLVAFANSDGGTLLVGVKDNGKISGVKSDEDFYVVEAAAEVYSKPSVGFEFKSYLIQGKKLYEIYVPASARKPHKCKDDDGKLKAYFRSGDKNLFANGVMMKVWDLGKKKRPPQWQYSKAEQILFEYLREFKEISLSKFVKIARIRRRKAEATLARLVSWQVLEMTIIPTGCRFSFSANFETINSEGAN